MASTNIKSFFIETPQAEETAERKKAQYEYSIEVESGIDVVIKRTKAGSKTDTKYLALLLSQKQYYIKTERGGKITPVTSGSDIVGFLSGTTVDRPLYFEHIIVDTLDKSKDWCDAAFRALNDDAFIMLAKKRLTTLGNYVSTPQFKQPIVSTYNLGTGEARLVKNNLDMMNENSTLIDRFLLIYEEATGKNRNASLNDLYTHLSRNYYGNYSNSKKVFDWDTCKAFIALANVYGQDIAKDIFAEWAENEFLYGFNSNTLTEVFAVGAEKNPYGVQMMPGADGKNYTIALARGVLMNGINPTTKFEWHTFKEYLLSGALRSGYADNISAFLNVWADTLNMQLQVFGKIVDKYPEHLESMHTELAWKLRMLKVKIDEDKFAKAVEHAKDLAGTCKTGTNEWVLMAPSSREDIVNEATQMSNCVASYVNKMIEGNCTIMFLRRANAPETSVCTVEISPNHEVVQFKGKHNSTPTDEQYEALANICKKTGVGMSV